MLSTAESAIKYAREKKYPISLHTGLTEKYGDSLADNFQQLINWMNLNFNVIDKKILDAERKMQKAGRFNPIFRNSD
ncbi:hypothetical protein GCM10011425_36250 [Mucilaginibacter galii]|uniref:Uncharacterized protein n=1 Tax=Mucilaginibacter galii TaxID=2005073 RepID=A0A917N2Z4_9SPHI|nr:hypothetical protein GCM10011425_36250 [Mucilaginibacter galii]